MFFTAAMFCPETELLIATPTTVVGDDGGEGDTYIISVINKVFFSLPRVCN